MDYTTRLLLQKPDPDPVTGDFLDVSVLNANFDEIDAAMSFTPALSTARPATPFQGQAILETDTGETWLWGGSAWTPILSGGGAYNGRIGIGRVPSVIAQRLLQTWAGGGGATSQVLLQASSVANGHRALSTRGGSDTGDRWWVDFDGKMQWGPAPGTAGDTLLYRADVSKLETPDDFSCGRLFVNGAESGTVTQQVFTAGGTWNKPAGAKRVWVRIVGGGGAGGGSGVSAAGASSKGAGGGGGEYAEKWFNASALNSTETVVVGAGGTGVSANNGGNGGNSSFKGITANGGLGGTWTASNTAVWGSTGGDGGSGGIGTADIRSPGGGGGHGFSGPGLSAGGPGGSSALGGGGKSVASGGTGASTQGDDAAGYGGGGGGAHTNGAVGSLAQRGGHGKAGVVIVTTYF